MNLTCKNYWCKLILIFELIFLLSSCHFKNSADAYPEMNTIHSSTDCALMNGFWGVNTCFKSLDEIKTKDDCLAAQGVYVSAKVDVVCYPNISAIPKDVCSSSGYKWNGSSNMCTTPITN